MADDFERGYGLTEGATAGGGRRRGPSLRRQGVAYLIAAHVVEHAIDPRRFAAEISRVAQAGFVQVPSAAAERVFGWAFHPWLIEHESGRLVFAPKESERWDGLHDLYNASPLLRVAFFAHRSKFHHSVHWRGAIRGDRAGHLARRRHVRVRSRTHPRGAAALAAPGVARATSGGPALPRLRRIAKGEGADVLECVECRRDYPVAGGAPVLLREAVAPRKNAARPDRRTRSAAPRPAAGVPRRGAGAPRAWPASAPGPCVWSDRRDTASEKCSSSTRTKPKAIRNSAFGGVVDADRVRERGRARRSTRASPSRTSALNSQSSA